MFAFVLLIVLFIYTNDVTLGCVECSGRRKMVRLLQYILVICAIQCASRLGKQHFKRLARNPCLHTCVHEYYGTVFNSMVSLDLRGNPIRGSQTSSNSRIGRDYLLIQLWKPHAIRRALRSLLDVRCLSSSVRIYSTFIWSVKSKSPCRSCKLWVNEHWQDPGNVRPPK